MRYVIAWIAVFLMQPAGLGQRLLRSEEGYPARLVPADMAVLEAGEERSDIECEISVVRPALGFDLRYHTGYQLTIPLAHITPRSRFNVIFRVYPPDGNPVYFSQIAHVGELPDDRVGYVSIQGGFDVGPGAYRVEWMVRDTSSRICAKSWKVDAPDVRGDLLLASGRVEPVSGDPFRLQTPVEKQLEPQYSRVHILLNFSPSTPGATIFRDEEKEALLNIVRVLSRDPRIGHTDLTVFHLEQQKILYRQRNGGVSFPALGEAVNNVALGSIGVDALAGEKTPGKFLSILIADCERESPGAPLIFVGPQAALRDSGNHLAALANAPQRPPLYYLSYNPNPQTNPWSDVFDQTVRLFKGRRFGLHQPQDLLKAMAQLFTRQSN